MTTVTKVLLPPGAIIGRYSGSAVVGVFNISARSVDVANCLPWSRSMQLRWIDKKGQARTKSFSLPAKAEATIRKLEPNTAYDLVVMMPVVGGNAFEGDQTEQTRISFQTLQEAPSTGNKSAQRNHETASAAFTEFARLVTAAPEKRLAIDLVANSDYHSGKVCVHDNFESFPFGVDSQGKPFQLRFSLRLMPREHVHRGDRLRVIIYSYSVEANYFYGSIAAINGRSCPNDPVLRCKNW